MSTTTFHIRKKPRRDAECVKFSSMRLGEFSLTSDRQYVDEVKIPRMRKHVRLPRDLNEGFDEHEDKQLGGVECIFEWICRNKFNTESVDLITYRGILKKIATNAFDRFQNHWCFRLVKMGNLIAMDEIETEQKRQEALNRTRYQNLMTYHGRKLEEVTMEVVENEVDIVTTSKIAGYRCILAAEVDGVKDNGDLVEVKAHKVISHPQQMENYKNNKLLNTFIQCYLVGIPHILVGFRDNNGWLRHLQEYSLDQVEEECRDYWNKDFYMGFLGDVLSWALPQIALGKVYHMSYLGGEQITLEEVEDPGHIPQFFRDHASSCHSKREMVDSIYK